MDNDKKIKIEVIQTRDKDNVVEVLKKFNNLETVTRDFSKTYKNAITQAAPGAKQIVDRFHIYKNLTDDIYQYMKRTMNESIKIALSNEISTVPERTLTQREKSKKINTENKWKTIQEVKRLLIEGYTISEISKILSISRQTIYTYKDLNKPLERETFCILDEYIPRIKELIGQKYKIREIYEIIKKEGYRGKRTLFNSKISMIKHDMKINIKYLKRSNLKKLLYTSLEKLSDSNIKNDITEYLKINIEFKKIIDLICKFKEIFKSKNVRKLMHWIKEANSLNIKELTSFTKLLLSDYEAVKNAVKYKYSNGLTEGFNNKTKVIKRVMYGRCGFDLLRLKILA